MKLIVQPNTKAYQSYFDHGATGVLLGLEHFCTGFHQVYTLGEIEKLKHDYPTQEIFISMNKMIYDNELDEVKSILLKLDEINVTGVFFYDLAFLELKQEFNLKLDLVWNQTHMVTNAKTCQYYYDQGVHYAFLSSEITLDEMIEIKEKTNMNCMALLYGYPVVAHSKRKLLTNYYQFLDKPKKQELTIKEPVSKQEYHLIEEENGTNFYYGNCLNGTRSYLELIKHHFDYGLLKEETDHKTFLRILSLWKEGEETTEKEEWLKKMNDCIGSRNTGFFYRKTIFKVKKHEKN